MGQAAINRCCVSCMIHLLYAGTEDPAIRRVAADAVQGDVKPVGEGVYEMRFHFGPGYRVYFTYLGDHIVLLLAGGDKGTQRRDIVQAQSIRKGLGA